MKSSLGADAVLLFSLIIFFGGFSSALALISAALIHELGHIAAIYLSGGIIRGLRINASGFCMSYSGITSPVSELICILSGPLSGLIAAYAFSYLGNELNSNFLLTASGFSMLLSVYNLLPALPLDGGRALSILLSLCLSHKAVEMTLDISGIACGMALLTLGLVFHSKMCGLALFSAGIILLAAQTGLVKSLRM